MILDLHNHSIVSEDGRAKVENYCQWIRARNLPLDGFVLSEHRQFDSDSDYDALASQYGLVILKASEVETDYGHVLVFGVDDQLQRAFDFARIDLSLAQVVEATERCGAVAVPCHPGRPRVGMCAHVAERGAVAGVRVVEIYNGGSRGREDDAARTLAEEFGYRGIGGSDAHIVSHIGRCATRFPAPVRSAGELVDALRAGEFEALSWKSTSTS
jgi:hypothetical protein